MMTSGTDGGPSCPRRRFSLRDGMILIGAIALVLGWSRVEPGDPGWAFYTPYMAPSYLAFLQARAWVEFAVLGLSTLTIAQIAFRLLPPRPTWRKLMHQPGWIACLSTIPFMSILMASHGFAWAMPRFVRTSHMIISGAPAELPDWLLTSSAQTAGLAVLVSWLILKVGGRWRSEPSWVDRLGRAIGVAWIATIPIETALEIAARLL